MCCLAFGWLNKIHPPLGVEVVQEFKEFQEFQEFQSSRGKFNRRKRIAKIQKTKKVFSVVLKCSFCFELDILMLKDFVLQMFNFPHHLSIHEELFD